METREHDQIKFHALIWPPRSELLGNQSEVCRTAVVQKQQFPLHMYACKYDTVQLPLLCSTV